jgi:hypothetical protein
MEIPQVDLIEVESKIYLIRGHKVMLDYDLAELYQVPTMRLNEQVRRNLNRFPSDFMFTLSNQEFRNLISQIAISSSNYGGRRKPPLAFTEQGVAMLSSVLKSERAAEVNIEIMRTFVKLREVLKMDQTFEKKILELESKYDEKFRIVFAAIKELMSERAVPKKRIIGLGETKE